MADEVHIEVLEFGGAVPPRAHLIPFPRKPDGSPDLAKGMASVSDAVEAHKQGGHSWIFLECAPHA